MTPSRRAVPMDAIEVYSRLAARRAEFERLEDGRWFARIPGFRGLWADGDSQDESVANLVEVAEDGQR